MSAVRFVVYHSILVTTIATTHRLISFAIRSLIQRLPLPYAVFDLHFHPSRPFLLAVATSKGSIALFRIDTSDEEQSASLGITHIWTRSIVPEEEGGNGSPISALFLSWAPRDFFIKTDDDGLAVTSSDGRTTLVASIDGDFINGDNVSEVGVYNAKPAIEVWFVALAVFITSTAVVRFMFTGDDFGSLYTRRFNAAAGKAHLQMEAESNDGARHHTAGVTCILPLPYPASEEELVNDGPLLLTGSYDEFLRVYRASRSGSVLAELGLGGGVWRLELLRVDGTGENIDYVILASCMHAGCRMVRVSCHGHDGSASGLWEIKLLAEFTGHQSMNYASDVWKGRWEGGRSELLCMSSSFYDRRVCLWTVKVDY